MRRRHKDLQPWLDCFAMLRSYEQKGLLEVAPDGNEAYVTLPALHAMSEGDDPLEQLKKAVPATVRRIRAYAGWKAAQGSGFPRRNFALHVVRDMDPHDLVYTMLLVPRRPWWKPWRVSDRIEVVVYGTDGKSKNE